jgi:hypothetical protein
LRADVTRKSEFHDALDDASKDCSELRSYAYMIKQVLEQGSIHRLMSLLNTEMEFVDYLYDFLEEYDEFLELMEKKFGIETISVLKVLKETIGEVRMAIAQMKVMLSKNDLISAKSCSETIDKESTKFYQTFDSISILPEKIDYSKLDPRDWKLIGIPGLHYRPKVFLSYPWRGKNPKKDTNEMMIETYVKPMLKLLDIEPVTLRDHLRPQDQVDDRATQLIGDSDGIIGFYTKSDRAENVEHELSQSGNIVAICSEIGAKTPSMRRSRWQIEFSRQQMGDLVIELMKAFKEKELFRLVI